MTGELHSGAAVACANIALAKYWGKLEGSDNLTAVPSLSLTLDALRTMTRVTFDPLLSQDAVALDGVAVQGRALARVSVLLQRVRHLAKVELFARVESKNSFPTASGLASSASGFAALVVAAAQALGLELAEEVLSSLARTASASAARSLFGGFAALGAGAQAAERVASGAHFPVCMLVCVTDLSPKAVSSTDGMRHTASTSPYYERWVSESPALFDRVKQAVLERDFENLGIATEESALLMHACMMAARPTLLYWTPATLEVIRNVRALREQGTAVFFTVDAGPHVKVLCLPDTADRVKHALA
ncbi:MAG TPA: diphosphomevalonate decarboxylase, partial [Polyangiaceae bacterium]